MIYRSLHECMSNVTLDHRYILDESNTDTKLLPLCSNVKVALWTDGSFIPNESCSSGIYGVIYSDGYKNTKKKIPDKIKLPYFDDIQGDKIHLYTIHGVMSHELTTVDTNQMSELYAIVKALDTAVYIEKTLNVELEVVEILSDSQYGLYVVEKIMNGGAWSDATRGWQFYDMISDSITKLSARKIKLTKVKGHSGNIGNVRADKYASFGNNNPNINVSNIAILSEVKKITPLCVNDFDLSNFLLSSNGREHMVGIDIPINATTEVYVTTTLMKVCPVLSRITEIVTNLRKPNKVFIANYDMRILSKQDVLKDIRQFGLLYFKLMAAANSKYQSGRLVTVYGHIIFKENEDIEALDRLIRAEEVVTKVERWVKKINLLPYLDIFASNAREVLIEEDGYKQLLRFGEDLPTISKLKKCLSTKGDIIHYLHLVLDKINERLHFSYVQYSNSLSDNKVVFYNYNNLVLLDSKPKSEETWKTL